MPSIFTPFVILTHHIYQMMNPFVTLFVFLVLVGVIIFEIVTENDSRDVDVMVLLWSTSLVFIPFLLSYILQPMLQARYTIAGVPGTVLLVGKAVDRVRCRIDEVFIRRVFVLGLVVVLAAPLLPYYQEDQKEQWREAGAFLEDEVHEGDVVLVSKSYTARNLRWYFGGDENRVIGVNATDNRTSLKQNRRQGPRLACSIKYLRK